MSRIDRIELFMEAAALFAKRSTCLRGNVGCVIVQDRRIVASGYNGAPPGMEHCTKVGCGDEAGGAGCQRSIHAEANALAFAARHGVPVEGATLYCTHGPCLRCAQLMASAGIHRVYYRKPYRTTEGLQLLDWLCIDAVCVQPKSTIEKHLPAPGSFCRRPLP